jgi:predicted Zn-dependent protease
VKGIIIALGVLFALAAHADDLSEAKRLLEAGQAAAAFEILQPLEATTPEADYLLGIAALDNGKTGIALFAFQRVLAQQPNHIFARAELGRTFLRLGEVQDAKTEFERVRELDAPREVIERIDRYEAALTSHRQPRLAYGGYAEGKFGFDSNYTSATSDQSVAIPAFGNLLFTLNDLFTEDGSVVSGGRAGGYLLAPVTAKGLPQN